MIVRVMKRLLLLLPALLLAPHALAESVDSLDALDKAIARLAPGVTVDVADGSYRTTGPIRIEGKHGTEEKPIVFRGASWEGGAQRQSRICFAGLRAPHAGGLCF